MLLKRRTGRRNGVGPGRRPLLTAALALTLLAAGFAAWTGWSWYAAAHDSTAATGQSRDQVLADGEQAVQNLNTLDYRSVDQGLDVWQSSTTGDLHSQFTQGRAQFEQQVKSAQTVTTAKILSGAVTELDGKAGKASIMVAVRITVTAPKAAPSTKDSRMVADLTRTAAGWKLSALGQAAEGS
ncbi:hypothetical protein ACEZCY_06355 [Streptacidiphilus sp. N1-12]|uniref:Mce-associated membrane protein n=2 Tax=Streptacidiphilus alkalitolerans TaxID=3342712 RepID=A0ABV6V5A5_9ACTN